MPVDASGDSHYSFPVIMSGIGTEDPLSTRAARMKIFTSFLGDLDSTGEHFSQKVSEVYLSDPEDVKALIPEGQNDVLVHFGDSSFLDRYRKFQQHLAEWRAQYPKLTGVDMRYDRQVVLDMQPGTEVANQPGSGAAEPQSGKPSTPQASKLAATPAEVAAAKPVGKPVATHAGKPAPRPAGKAPAKAAPAKSTAKPVSKPTPKAVKKRAAPAAEEWHMVVVKPHTKAAAALAAKAKPAHPSQASPQ